MKRNLYKYFAILCLGLGFWFAASVARKLAPPPKTLQLYWFIPDGFRAEPVTMQIYEWARQGFLPNIRWMMEHGSYGYSIPVFPGHTPANMATLVTGALPAVHGVSDIGMHTSGKPLANRINGFSSGAKLVPPIWVSLEAVGRTVALLSIPGSTPPDINNGIVVRGRWGGWGIDFPAVIFQSEDRELHDQQPAGEMLALGSGPELTQMVALKKPAAWELPLPKTFSPGHEVELMHFGVTVFGYIYDSTDDHKTNYDHVLLSLDRKSVFANLTLGENSGWKNLGLTAGETKLHTLTNVRLIRAEPLRIRFYYDNLNPYVLRPPGLFEKIHEATGPMVDFPDSFPPQLIYFNEDKDAFLNEAGESLAWHKKMARFLIGQTDSQIILHNIYTPNQMLTSRWWLPYLDPKSAKYKDVTEEERAVLWAEVKDMYRKIDEILGEVIQNASPDTYIVLSSDHGVVPMDKEVLLNNFLAKRGWLKTLPSGDVDWKNTRAVFLASYHIFLSLSGFQDSYQRAATPEFLKFKREVQTALAEFKDEHGVSPLAKVASSEDAKELGLPEDRAGDLILSFTPGFSGAERVTAQRELFKKALKGGYKQGVSPLADGMLTPFMITGPGVKKGLQLKEPIHHQDQYPTIFKLLGLKSPDFVQGHVVNEIMEPR